MAGLSPGLPTLLEPFEFMAYFTLVPLTLPFAEKTFA
jgi:hypothetical protein